MDRMHTLVGLALLTAVTAAAAAEPASFLRPGDRWVMAGDSITHSDLYRQKLLRVQKHFHPDVPFAVTQVGVSGVASGYDFKGVAEKATVVSIMLGMNNYINSNVVYGTVTKPALDAYEKDMEAKAQEFRKAGTVVLLFTPTLTDPRFDHGIYELRGGEAFLRECGNRLRAIAARNEGVYVLPVQEEMEAYEQTLGNYEILRIDGVHPSASGQYQIARTLWEHLDLAAPMPKDGPRALAAKVPGRVPVDVKLASRMLKAGEGVELVLKAAAATTVKATWSAGDARGSESLTIASEKETRWALPLPAQWLGLAPGQLKDVVVDLAADGRRSVYLLDLAGVRVLHAKDGTFSGSVMADKDRPEGRTVANWTAEPKDKALLFSGEVFDNDLQGDEFWAWGRDGVNLYLDLRPTERFANIGFDEEVHIAMLTVRDQPAFMCTLIPWIGRGMHLAADAGGERTPTGYRWRLYLSHFFTKKNVVDFSKRDFVGLCLVVPDRDGNGKGGFETAYWRAGAPEDNAPDKHPNAYQVLDLKNKLAADSVVNVSLFGR